MDRSRKFIFLIATLAMTGAFSGACDSGTQEPAAPDHSTSPDAGDAGLVPSPSETSAAAAPDLPDEFPEELTVYPGSTSSLTKGVVANGVPMAAVQLQTADSPDEVFDFYLDKFGRDGWVIEEQTGSQIKNIVTATNGKCRAIMMATPKDDGGTGTNIFLVTEC